MILSYSVISLLIVVVLGVLFNLFIDGIFEQYAVSLQKQRIDNTISQVNEQFDESTGSYNVEGLAVIGSAALQNGIIVHIQTVNKEIDWDIQSHKAQECLILLQHAEANMHSRYPNFRGGYAENTYDLRYGDEVVGYITTGYYGPYSLGDNELVMIKQLNMVIAALGTVFLLMGVLFGVFEAKRIASPIISVINTARKIADGNYGVKTSEKSPVTETSKLIASINDMSLELERSEQQKKQLSADVAHELRTPLNNLQSHMEAMIDGVWEPNVPRLKSCHAEIIRLSQIVAQLQELYSLEMKSAKLDKEAFDFSDLCDAVFADFEISAQSKNIRLVRRIPVPAPVFGDIKRLKQCLVNLISNAVNYSPEGGDISITYQSGLRETVIKVKDNGMGIPSEDLPHIFDRFYRVDKSRNRVTGGMGVGLSITKAIVEAHGGKIMAAGDDIGMVFTIRLPFGDNRASP
jgi:signal transduction histidine kinase